MQVMRAMMGRLRLEVNEAKTGIRRLPAERVELLGYALDAVTPARRVMPTWARGPRR
jgi:hypothetical protein